MQLEVSSHQMIELGRSLNLPIIWLKVPNWPGKYNRKIPYVVIIRIRGQSNTNAGIQIQIWIQLARRLRRGRVYQQGEGGDHHKPVILRSCCHCHAMYITT